MLGTKLSIPNGARLAIVAVVALAASLGSASGANAAVNITSFSATPSTTLAAAHPNFSTSIRLSYSDAGDDIRSVETRLPPGLLGNPRAVASCTTAQLTADTCPAGSKIGTTSTIAKPDLPLVPALTASGDVYNVAPVGNEPARIGLVIRPVPGPISLAKFSLVGVAGVRVPGDFGLNVRFDNLPRALALVGGLGVPIQVQGLDLTLTGIVGSRAYMTNPTSCIPATTTLSATSYNVATPVSRTSTFTPTDCAGVPFNPFAPFVFPETIIRADKPTTVRQAWSSRPRTFRGLSRTSRTASQSCRRERGSTPPA